MPARCSTSASAPVSRDEKRRELVEFLAPYRENALADHPWKAVGGARSRGRRAGSGCRAARAAGARARICRGSRCGRNWWSKWRTSTCRARASVTWRSSEVAHRQEPARLHLCAARSGAAAGADGDFRERPLSSRLAPARFAPFPRRIVVRIGSLLRRPQLFRHMAQVHADARPGGRPAAHRIDQHVVHGQQFGRLGMLGSSSVPGPPARLLCRANSRPRSAASSSRGAFFARGGLGARRRHARRFAFHLAKVRRPGRVAQSRGFVLRREFQQLLERPGARRPCRRADRRVPRSASEP